MLPGGLDPVDQVVGCSEDAAAPGEGFGREAAPAFLYGTEDPVPPPLVGDQVGLGVDEGLQHGQVVLVAEDVAELLEATRSVTCYAGRFEVKGDEVHHHVEMALNPNLVGQTMIRRVQFDGADLTLSARPNAQGEVRCILWRRLT